VISVPILAALLFPVFGQARERAREASCLSNIRQQGVGVLMYAQDYDEKYPPATAWMDVTSTYMRDATVRSCPSVPGASTTTFGYAYNSKLSRIEESKIRDPKTTPMIYDSSNLAKNASDAVTSLPSPARHLKNNNMGYADGHAKRIASGSQ
jgi:prepilin-type processing-associated H-X9-DG protein